MSNRRMEAYWYEFSPTGVDAIDKILSAVAFAGKAYHHTEDWGCKTLPRDDHTGDTPVDWIQNAANEAATIIKEQYDYQAMQPELAAIDAALYKIKETTK